MRPTCSCRLRRSRTTSADARAVAGSALVSGRRAAIAPATASARANAPGSASLVTTTRCFARKMYHCRYGEWPRSSAPAAPRSKARASLLLAIALEDVELQEVGDDEVRHVDQVADLQVAGDATQDVGLREVHVSHRQQVAVHEAREEERGPLHHLLDVGVAAVLPGRNGAQAAIARASRRAAQGGGHGILRLRKQHEPTRPQELVLPQEGGLDLGPPERDTDGAGEAVQRDPHAGDVPGGRELVLFLVAGRAQLPVHDRRVGENVAEEAT